MDGVTSTPPDGPPVIRRKKSAKVQFTSTVLLLEAFVVVFAAFVLYGLRDVPGGLRGDAGIDPTAIWLLGGVFFVVFVVLSRACGKPGGYVAGSVSQVLLVALAALIPLMALVTIVFVVLWVAALRLGGKVDRERAAYDAAHPDEAPNVD